ncbi:MAG: hypothetical protein GX060_05335 [Firmicutes bacterium]|nr:hypothetical protein [Bacillota bacterium]
MAKILRFPNSMVRHPTREDISTKELKQTCISLDKVEHEIIAQNGFNLEQHLTETADYLFYVNQVSDGYILMQAGRVLERQRHPRGAFVVMGAIKRDWIKMHKSNPGYAVRYNDEVWPELAQLLHLPLVKVEGETYLLVYDNEIITTAKLAAYQAMSLGVVDPSMVDVVLSEAFRKIIRDKFGVKVLAGAISRLVVL